jgi:Uma2 family endonuclease
MIANRVPYLSPEEYLEWEEKSEIKHEYIDGEIFAMAGASDDHWTIVSNASSILKAPLKGSGCRQLGDVKAKIFHRRRFYYPDLMVTCDDRDQADRYVKRYYKLIIEVLSDSTEGFDRGDKFQDYRRSDSLEEYVLISQNQINVDAYRKNLAGRWELQAYQTGDRVELVSLGLDFPIADLYEDVTLPPQEIDEEDINEEDMDEDLTENEK